MTRVILVLLMTLGLTGCFKKPDAGLLGTLEWDRVAVAAEASEPVMRWLVAEGDRVEAGDLLLELDPSRLRARLHQAEAEVAGAEAALLEARNGARSQTLDRARAGVARAQAAVTERRQEYMRQSEMLRRRLTAVAARDAAETALRQAEAAAREADAQLRELLAGTRVEQVAQAEAALATATATRDWAALAVQRLRIVAPRAGRIDALPFKPGDQPPIGATVASLLVGDAPYVRAFVPAPMRATIKVGDEFRVVIQGVAQPFAARLRSIRSEPNFTPYYALSGDDATRLVYRAELVLAGDAARALPAGLPVSALPSGAATAEHSVHAH